MELAITMLVSLAATILGFLIGRRYERGNQEVEAMLRDEVAAKRAGRPGTVKLKTMRIRR